MSINIGKIVPKGTLQPIFFSEPREVVQEDSDEGFWVLDVVIVQDGIPHSPLQVYPLQKPGVRHDKAWALVSAIYDLSFTLPHLLVAGYQLALILPSDELLIAVRSLLLENETLAFRMKELEARCGETIRIMTITEYEEELVNA